MDLKAILKQLIEEKNHLDQSILAIERLASSGMRRRGRPPNWIKEAKAEIPRKRGRPAKAKAK
jgi:hypothetical protein